MTTKTRIYITNGDVMSSAVKMCQACKEPGLHVVLTKDAKGNEVRTEKLCPKAWDRYMKKHPGLEFDPSNQQFFLELEEIAEPT
jgi:hypothetical protein